MPRKVSLDDIRALIPSAHDYGHYLMGRCLFHDDHQPSLQISKVRYVCKSCGARGSLAQLLKVIQPGDPRLHTPLPKRDTEGAFPPYSNLGAVRDRLMRAHDRLMDTERLTLYLKRRCLDDIILKYELGWWDNWYTVPIRDRHYNILGGVARASSIAEDKYGRFDIPSGQPPLFYVPDWPIFDHSPYVIIVYGIFDALSLAKLGFPVGTPTSGKDSMDPDWLKDVRKPIYVMPDQGETRTAKQLITKLGFRGKLLEMPYTDTYNDPNSMLCEAPQLLYSELEKVANEPRGLERSRSRKGN